MRVKRLRLVNFRVHRDITIELDSGITAIVGDNGSGKSSIVEGLKFLLTASLLDAKHDVIRRGCADGFVEGELEINGKPAWLTRSLVSSKAQLEFDGVTYKKASEIKAKWEELFMLSPDIVDSVLIAEQGATTTLFDGEFNTRLKLFQKIFTVPNTDKLRTLVWDKFIKTAPPLKACSMTREQVEKNTDELQTNLEGINQLMDELHAQLDDIDIEKLQVRRGLASRYVSTMPTILTAMREIQTDVKTKGQVQVTLDAANARLVELQEVYEVLNLHANRKIPEGTIAWVEEAMANTHIPERVNVNALYDELGERKAVLASLVHESKSCTADCQDSHCPTCNRPYDNHEEVEIRQAATDAKLEDLTNHIVELNIEVSDLERRIREGREQNSQHDKGTSLRASHLRSLQEAKDRLAALPPLDTKGRSIDELLVLFKDFEPAKVEVTKLTKEIERLNLRISSNQGILKTADPVVQAAFSSVEGAQEAMVAIDSQLNEATTLRKQLDRLFTEQSVCAFQLGQIQKLKEECDLVDAHNAKVRDYLSVMQGAYDAFHPTRFPSILIGKYTEAISEALRRRLFKFRFPYKVHIDDQFRVVLSDHTGEALPRVSGGQKVMIGLAMRLALHDMFGQAFPLLVIDEGSVHLDEGNRKTYFELISSLRRECPDKQIIVIDHVPELADYVEHTIQLTTQHD